jgi:hypothetical protein
LDQWGKRAAQNVASGNGGPGASSMVMFCLRNIDSGEWKDTRELRHAGPNAEPVRTIDATMTAQEAIEAYHLRRCCYHEGRSEIRLLMMRAGSWTNGEAWPSPRAGALAICGNAIK